MQYSFQTDTRLCFVMEYVNGGDVSTIATWHVVLYLYANTNAYIHTHMHIRIFTHTQTDVHAHTHSHMRTHARKNAPSHLKFY